MLESGLYEQVINKQIEKALEETDLLKLIAPIDAAEASKVLSDYLADIIEKSLENAREKSGGLENQIALTNKLVSLIETEMQDHVINDFQIDDKAQQLLALLDPTNSIYALNKKAEIVRPETSLAISSLFTGAVHEPSMFSELKKEIASCDRIDMLVSFIKWSGLRLIIGELRDFTQRGGSLRADYDFLYGCNRCQSD